MSIHAMSAFVSRMHFYDLFVGISKSGMTKMSLCSNFRGIEEKTQ